MNENDEAKSYHEVDYIVSCMFLYTMGYRMKRTLLVFHMEKIKETHECSEAYVTFQMESHFFPRDISGFILYQGFNSFLLY